ncbi:hypothetical protein G7Y89_g475 [Cudoniella acicularis]|uniref:Uncharacterized protein n=1 Tax=Cudoniella acicularis TaxID=354080 RepID=A0A8H4W8A1_9HELO|nr:hypothetical protein G7Y89_g475 [Cudoniella acicularis]
MTPRKTRPRHQNSASQSLPVAVQPSDYESEAFYAPPIPTRSNTELNLSVLRRYHPSIQSILSIAPSAQIYTYLPETTSWNKTEIEGTLFVCQLAPSTLSGSAQHCIVVLNRRGLDNLIIDVATIENVEITDQFLMLSFQSHQDEGQQNLENTEMKTIGFFIHADKHDTREVNCRLIKEKWEEARATKSTGERETLPGEISMGRRLSLTDLFGQQALQCFVARGYGLCYTVLSSRTQCQFFGADPALPMLLKAYG